jgi:hypothetical protein
MELSLGRLPDDGINVSGFGGRDGCVILLDVMPQVDTVLRLAWLVQVFKTDMWLELLQPGAQYRPDRTHMGCCALPSSLTDRRKLDIFLGGRPTEFVLCRDSTLLMGLNVDPT